MSDTQSILAGWDAARERQAPAAAPASIGEIWSANWAAAGLSTPLGAGKPFGDARSDIVSGIEGAAGMPLGEYARQQGLPLGAAGTPDDNIRELTDIAGTLPEDAQKRLAPLLDWRRNAQEKAATTERTAADVNAAAYGLGPNAVRFAAGLARSSVDPVNLAAMVVTAPIGGEATLPLWQVLARQALAGGAAQLLAEPSIQSTRAELGLEHGIGMAAEDVMGAAAGNAAFAGGLTALLRGGAMALRMARRSRPGAPGEILATPTPGGAEPLSESPSPVAGHPGAPGTSPLAPADLEAAARLTERDQTLDAAAPAGVNPAEHAARVEGAAEMLESDRMPPTMERLSELQLGEIAGHATKLDATAAAARTDLDAALAKISDREADLTARTAELEPLRQDVAGLQADLADAQKRLGAVRGPTDPETQARLDAIAAELGQPNLPGKRRGELEAEHASITETLAATGPMDAHQAASISQEIAGLNRALERNQKLLAKGQGAIDKLAAKSADRAQTIGQQRADLDARLASQKQIVSNELRRSIARLAAEGYSVRLTRAEAETFAEHVLAARPEDLPGALRDVTQELVNRRIADTGLMVQRQMPPALSDLPLPPELRFVQRVGEAIAGLGTEQKIGAAFVARVKAAIAEVGGEKKSIDGAAFVQRVQHAITELEDKPADGVGFVRRVQQAIAELGDKKAGDAFVQRITQAIAELEKEKPAPVKPAVKPAGEPVAKPAGEPAAKPKPEGAPSPSAPRTGARFEDPGLAADAGRVLEEAGGDFQIRLDENAEPVSAREALAGIDEEATAARELAACAAMEATE